MQTLTDIRELLAAAGIRPKRSLGQNFLIDANLMGKLLELAELGGGETVLEVGAATGSLTEELLDRARRVVAVEKDDALADILARRLGDAPGLTIVRGDALAGKHALADSVLSALRAAGEPVDLVANLPYSAAVPIVLECLLSSWRAGSRPDRLAPTAPPVRFRRLTFTVQREVAERLTARPGGRDYGPPAIVTALLARATPGRRLPAQAFWPPPKIVSQMLRLDFDPAAAGKLASAADLQAVCGLAFSQRRKRIGAAARRRSPGIEPAAFAEALDAAGIDPDLRPEQVAPEAYLIASNRLTARRSDGQSATIEDEPAGDAPGAQRGAPA